MNHPRTLGPIARRLALWGLVALALLTATPASAGPEGQLTWGVHLSLVTRWLDPGEMEGILTPFLFYSALHDALVKPMPGHAMLPSLALSLRVLHAGRRARARGIRGLLAQDAERQAARPARHAGGNHACRRAQEGRGRHRLPPERSRGGGDQTDAGSAAGGAAGGWRLLAGLSRPVGSEISLARATRAAG